MDLRGGEGVQVRMFLVLELLVLPWISPRTQWRQLSLLLGEEEEVTMSAPLPPISQDQLLEVCIPPCIQIGLREEQNDHVSLPWIIRIQFLMSQHSPWSLSGWDKCTWHLSFSLDDDHSPDGCDFHGSGVELPEGQQGAL